MRGKSGLHEARVPGNARRGQPQGKRHRERDRPACRVRVKRWGKSPLADRATGTARQAPPGAMPNRGLARGRSGNRYRRRDASAREARVGSLIPPVTAGPEEWSSRGETPGQNPAYRPSAHLNRFPYDEERRLGGTEGHFLLCPADPALWLHQSGPVPGAADRESHHEFRPHAGHVGRWIRRRQRL